MTIECKVCEFQWEVKSKAIHVPAHIECPICHRWAGEPIPKIKEWGISDGK